jgi:uncharacterized protein YbjT (DUF2867 family)
VRVLVLGGYGAVGAKVVAELRSSGDTAFAAGRDPSRADRVIDPADQGSYRSAVSDVDVVINGAGLESPRSPRSRPRSVWRSSTSGQLRATSRRWSF